MKEGERVKKAFPSAGRLSEGPRDGYFNARQNRTFTARLKGTALVAMALLTLADGCAMQPPTNQNTLSGPRLVVTMNVQGSTELGGYSINPSYYYFFVINYATQLPNQPANLAGIKGAPGPIAVFQPTGGPTGFVASSDGSTFGYTDYVEFSQAVPNSSGYGLFHFIRPNPNNLQEVQSKYLGQPAQYTIPNGTTLKFTIYLTQLVQAANPSLSSALALQQAQGIQYLQANFIATSSINSTSGTPKATDALGPGANSSFLNLNLNTFAGGTISNSNNALGITEPSGDVTVVNGANLDPSLDLIDWSITYYKQ